MKEDIMKVEIHDKAIKRLDLVQLENEQAIYVVLGLGNDGEADVALIAAVYNVVSENHANIPNVMVYVRDLRLVEARRAKAKS